MPTLHLNCGLPGSVKMTLAKRLEHELPALRLAPDEWMTRIFGGGSDEDNRAVFANADGNLLADQFSVKES